MYRYIWGILIVLICITGVLGLEVTNVKVLPSTVEPNSLLYVTFSVEDTQILRSVTTELFLLEAISFQENTYVGNTEHTFSYVFDLPRRLPSNQLIITVDAENDREFPTRVAIPLITREQRAQIQERMAQKDGPVLMYIEPIRNVERDFTVFFPVILKSTSSQERTVLLGLEEIREFAAFRIVPEQFITLKAFEEKLVYVAFKVPEDAPLGMHHFNITLEYENTREVVPTAVAVITAQDEEEGRAWWIPGLIFLLVIIALAIIVIAWFTQQEEDDEELITHY